VQLGGAALPVEKMMNDARQQREIDALARDRQGRRVPGDVPDPRMAVEPLRLNQHRQRWIQPDRKSRVFDLGERGSEHARARSDVQRRRPTIRSEGSDQVDSGTQRTRRHLVSALIHTRQTRILIRLS